MKQGKEQVVKSVDAFVSKENQCGGSSGVATVVMEGVKKGEEPVASREVAKKEWIKTAFWMPENQQ